LRDGIKIINTQNIIEISVFGKNFSLLSKNGSIYEWNPLRRDLSEIISTNHINRTDKWVSISGNLVHLSNPQYSTNPGLLALTKSGRVYRITKEKIMSIAEHISNEYNIDIKDKFKNVIFKKISNAKHYSLLLSNDGIIYTFGENRVGQLGLKNRSCHFHIIENNVKFIDIATHYSLCTSIAVAESVNIYIWGRCGYETIYEPKLTDFKTIDEVFVHYFDSDYNHFKNRIS
jgi:alpha-tubulin suppressor-like RCC1 family protein